MSRCQLFILEKNEYPHAEFVIEEACVGFDPGIGLFYCQVIESRADEPLIWIHSSDANEVVNSVLPYVKPFDKALLLANLQSDKENLSERTYMIE